MERNRFEYEVRRLFEHDIPARFEGVFEARESQVAMAAAVARTIIDRRLAVIEAETGLGKSLAYLVPVLAHCAATGARAVISTYTRTLQQQLIEYDVGRAAAVIDEPPVCAVLMGRTNYLCRRAAERLLAQDPHDEERNGLLHAILEDRTGELERIAAVQELDGATRAAIAAPAWDSACRGCARRDACALIEARRRALEAHIVFVNHALLFADVAAAGSLLGPYDVLVIDEAHHLQDVATSYLTVEFTPDSLRGSGASLFPAGHRDILAYARDMAIRDNPGRASEIERLWRSIHDQLDTAQQAVRTCFSLLDEAVRSARTSLPDGAYGSSFVYGEGSPLLYGIDEHAGTVQTVLATIGSALEQLESMLEMHDNDDDASPAAALRSYRDAARELAYAFEFLISASDDAYVFSLRTDRRGSTLALTAQPIDVSGQLGALLEECGEAQILTSATLAVDGDFSYLLGMAGISRLERVGTYVFETPFDLKRQRTLLLASFMPPPGSPRFTGEVAGVIAAIAREARRNILVLCTSREQVSSIQAALSRSGDLEPLLLSQVAGVSRNRLAAAFREEAGRILLGLASFWEGVDFPGELLEVVVIVKMPFLVPFEPIVRARADKLQREGENPFHALFLPDAALKLKQGAGRLIRTSSDRGVVILLDSRLGEKSYGPVALRSITGDVIRCDSRRRLLAELETVFSRES